MSIFRPQHQGTITHLRAAASHVDALLDGWRVSLQAISNMHLFVCFKFIVIRIILIVIPLDTLAGAGGGNKLQL